MWPAVAGNRRSAARVRAVDARARKERMVTPELVPGDRGMAPRRRRRAPPLLHVRHRPRFRPRLRRDAARRHVGLRDVGRARRRRVERRAAVPRLDRRQPRRRARPAAGIRRPAGGTVSSDPASRSTPIAGSSCAPTSSAAVRARPGRRRRRRCDGKPFGSRFPGDHDPRHGARPGAARRPPRHRRLAHRHRRLDGRHAGPRVGRHVPAAGARASCRSPPACRRRRSRSPGAASAGG